MNTLVSAPSGITLNPRTGINPLDTLTELRGMSAEMDSHKVDWNVPASGMMVSPAGSLEVNMNTPYGLPQVSSMQFSENALAQLLTRLSPALFGKGSTRSIHYNTFAAMLEQYPAEMFAPNINHLLSQHGGLDFLVRQYKGVARAVLSERYAVLQNTEVIRLVIEALEAELKFGNELPELRVVRTWISPDDMILRVVFKTDKPVPGFYGDDPEKGLGKPNGNYGLGVIVRNNEVGRGGIEVNSAIWRTSCTNSIIPAAQPIVRLTHTGSWKHLLHTVADGIRAALVTSADALDSIYEAETTALPSFASILDGIAIEHGLSRDTMNVVRIGTEAQETKMGVVNGLSYAAHKTAEGENSLALEWLAGAMLAKNVNQLERYARISERSSRDALNS